ncbi:MAG: Hsp33 family molecular chaperone HslO [Pseudomonadota bacterium]|nr:Hsp33 family molecular chaperone HslO [Pseudomonadota bacterium]
MTDRTGDVVSRFHFEHFPVRGEVVHLDATWQEAQRRADYPAPVRDLVGEAMAAGALLAATLKFKGRLSLQIESEGAVRLLLVQCDHQLHLRATARFQEPLSDPLLIGGRVMITIEPEGQGERYQGIVALESGGVAAALEHYFERSEQLPTRLHLAVDEHCASGMLIQRLPGESSDADAWNRCTHLAASVRPEELRELPVETLLHRLFFEEDVRVFEPRPTSFRCRCSRERVAGMLQSLGEEEVRDIVKEQGRVSVTCEFCGKGYEFDKVDVELLFSSGFGSPSSDRLH